MCFLSFVKQQIQMNGSKVHNQRMDDKLSPWAEQSSHIPAELFNSTTAVPSRTQKKSFHPRIVNPSKSATAPTRGLPNHSTLHCSAYKWIDPCISGLLLTQQVRETKVMVATRKLSKGLEIKSIRKKIFNSWQNGLSRDARSVLPEFVTASKIDEITKESMNDRLHSTKRVFFEQKTRHRRRKDPVYHHPREFITEICTISAASRSNLRVQRSRTEQSPSKDWKILRETFIHYNPRFMQWQQQTSKRQQTTISLP